MDNLKTSLATTVYRDRGTASGSILIIQPSMPLRPKLESNTGIVKYNWKRTHSIHTQD